MPIANTTNTPETNRSSGTPKKRVAYLLGAGATHAGLQLFGSDVNLLMSGLAPTISDRLRSLGKSQYEGNPVVTRLLNEVVGEHVDIEQLITFLAESGSREHRELSDHLENIFEDILRAGIEAVVEELPDEHNFLYAALLDMHQVEQANEVLTGFLTLNYDAFLENAATSTLDIGVDYGISVTGPESTESTVRVLKLHGSFGWSDSWPVEVTSDNSDKLWIPPGIRKRKASYPFNLLWGLAREILDCDVLRIIGCNLGANDWDLVSLLFATQHSHRDKPPYDVEIISSLGTAIRIKETFPYLSVKSLFDIETIGQLIVSELLGGEPRRFDDLSQDEQLTAIKAAKKSIPNPFVYWLRQKAETMHRDLASIETRSGKLAEFLESA